MVQVTFKANKSGVLAGMNLDNLVTSICKDKCLADCLSEFGRTLREAVIEVENDYDDNFLPALVEAIRDAFKVNVTSDLFDAVLDLFIVSSENACPKCGHPMEEKSRRRSYLDATDKDCIIGYYCPNCGKFEYV